MLVSPRLQLAVDALHFNFSLLLCFFSPYKVRQKLEIFLKETAKSTPGLFRKS
jgi:hypothetical protein